MTVDCSEAPGYAPGTQKSRVVGDVLKWHHDNGMEAIPAAEYIEQLENQISILKQQVGWLSTPCVCCNTGVHIGALLLPVRPVTPSLKVQQHALGARASHRSLMCVLCVSLAASYVECLQESCTCCECESRGVRHRTF